MPLDSNIILGVQRPKVTSPLEMYQAKAMIDQNELTSRLGGLKLREAEQQTADQNQLRDVYRQFGSDAAANTNALFKAGLGKEAVSYEKAQIDRQKSMADTQKAQIEAHLQKLNVAGQILSGVRDQASWDAARAQTAQMLGPEAAATMPPQFDAALVEQKRNQALSVKDQLEQKWKAMEYTTPKADARLSADTSRANNAATVGATIRGQNMVDSRSRESTAATLTKPFEITGPNGPVLVQQNKQGKIVEVEGYTPKQGASKPLTEGQSKALLFGSRMEEAGSVIDQLALEGRTKSVPGSRAPLIGGAVTAMSGEKNQKLEQAKRDFINATLRRESGAVIADSEFDNGEKQYFPQIGDTPAVIAQKKRNREVATRGILAEVPDSANRVSKVRQSPAAAPASAAAPNIDALLDKYK